MECSGEVACGGSGHCDGESKFRHGLLRSAVEGGFDCDEPPKAQLLDKLDSRAQQCAGHRRLEPLGGPAGRPDRRPPGDLAAGGSHECRALPPGSDHLLPYPSPCSPAVGLHVSLSFGGVLNQAF